MKPLRYFIFSLFVFITCFTLNQISYADTNEESYSKKFKEIILKETVLTASGRLAFPGPEAMDRPIKGFDKSDAVPFFIDVILNGPDWQEEYSERPLLPHLARCSAALNLGAHKDKRAFEPLVELLKNGRFFGSKDKIELRDHIERYDIRKYATIALGMSGDPRGVEVLIDSLKNDSNGIDKAAAEGLGRLGDARAIDPLLNVCNDSNSPTDLRIICFESLAKFQEPKIVPEMLNIAEKIGYSAGWPIQETTKVQLKIKFLSENQKITVEEFPDRNPFNSELEIWQHWYRIGKNWTLQEFEKNYNDYSEVKRNHSEQKSAINDILNRMLKLGVVALPLIIEKIDKGDTNFIPLASQLTNYAVKRDAEIKEVLNWWEANKEKWIIFDYSDSEKEKYK